MTFAIVGFVLLLNVGHDHQDQSIAADAAEVGGAEVRLVNELFEDEDKILQLRVFV